MASREPRSVCWFGRNNWFNFRHCTNHICASSRSRRHVVVDIRVIFAIFALVIPVQLLQRPENHFSGRMRVPLSSQPCHTDLHQHTVSGTESSPDSGMIVFTSSARILHMNEPARALMALFGTFHERWPEMTPDSMPSSVTEFCYDVLVQLRRRMEAHDWAQFEMRRVCHMVTPSLLLTGFGVPNSTDHELRIVLTLTPLSSNLQPFHLPTNIHVPITDAIS